MILLPWRNVQYTSGYVQAPTLMSFRMDTKRRVVAHIELESTGFWRCHLIKENGIYFDETGGPFYHSKNESLEEVQSSLNTLLIKAGYKLLDENDKLLTLL